MVNVREKKRNIQLECVLTDQEKLKYSAELAEHINTLQRLDDAKKSYMSQIKAEIESAQAQVNLLSRKLSSGKEYRVVKCAVEYNWELKEKHVFREDTWELVATDIITESELQEEADLNAPTILGESENGLEKPEDELDYEPDVDPEEEPAGVE